MEVYNLVPRLIAVFRKVIVRPGIDFVVFDCFIVQNLIRKTFLKMFVIRNFHQLRTLAVFDIIKDLGPQTA